MAEHYGVVPKKFSKEWWPYFWMYYKWHTIAIVFVVLSVLITAVQCATREKFDINITYAGTGTLQDETLEKFAQMIEPIIDDVDGNGEKNVFVHQMNFANQPQTAEWDNTLRSKLDMELNNETSFIFIYDKTMADERMNQSHADEIYLPVSEWAGGVPDEMCIKTADGVARAVCLKNSRMLAELGIVKADELYIAVKQNYSKDEKSGPAQKCSIEAAKKIIE